ncbi:CBS domain-containing protein [Natribacillus halophilus]|uniref:tRNA nucleotidyltransferase (CCA-adding enzyme) n=1 Tax=Natribacillus halophilus TaxID=549003 RepID=A0A1G8LG94_9BACI|nr:CBS domain-containing protein [Natribacillus halophilus]SDI54689.1 tRNA nucleotidyltransferase (CCA-adding enzyme) [Natribacillus halophilus]
MKIIAAHKHTDFDALASLVAAKKLHPEADVFLPETLSPNVKQYMAIYRDQFPYIDKQQEIKQDIDELILVDTSSQTRTGDELKDVHAKTLKIYDHHPESFHLSYPGETAAVGATITILIEHIREQELTLSDWERTLFALGLYTDTGSFTYEHTTSRDVQALLFLFQEGISLEVVHRFSHASFSDEQTDLLLQLLQNGKAHDVGGVSIMIGNISSASFIDHLNLIVEKWLDVANADACIAIAHMKKTIFITARSQHQRIDVSRALQIFDGGGHENAAAATVKDKEPSEVEANLLDQLSTAVKPALVAKQIMSHPVKSVSPDTSIETVREEIVRYGHSGFPVVRDNQLAGMISRRDVDKAFHHGLGHAPVKGHMSEQLITCEAGTTSEDVQRIMIGHDIGRLPVIANDELIGIISRSDLLKLNHDKTYEKEQTRKRNLIDTMIHSLSTDNYHLLKTIGQIADEEHVDAYLIGGIVRDFLLQRENEDIDIMIEGDGIAFAEAAARRLGGKLYTHESFQTAKILLESGKSIDIASARAEYYDAPSSLPSVTFSNLHEDLYRRDFTFNALAIQLNEVSFGRLIDPFGGEEDLQKGNIRVLHNLSFIEDPTRILRAIRFELKFDYTLAADTRRFAVQATSAIARLSADRIKAEFNRLFPEVTAAASFKRLEELELLAAFIPFASWSEQSRRMLQKIENEQLPENVQTISRLLPLFIFDGNLQHLARFALTKPEKQLLNDFAQWLALDEAAFASLGTLHESIHGMEETALFIFETYAEVAEQQRRALLIRQYRKQRQHIPLLVTGEDLKALPIAPGPQYKHFLLKVESLWLEDKIKTRDEALQWLRSEAN